MCRWSVPVLPAVLLALSALGCGSPACAEDDFKQQKARYEAYLERPSLYMRQRGRVRLADTRDPRALDILARSYARPEAPKDQVQYLLATICADRFTAAKHAPALRAWRRRHAQPSDAWLWYRALLAEHATQGPLELIDTIGSRRDGRLRAVALLALAESKDENAVPVLARLLDDIPPKPIERTVLLEAAAEVLWIARDQRSTEAWRAAASKLISWLDDRTLQERSRLVLARRFADLWRSDVLHREAAPWLARLEGRKPPETPAAGPRYAAPKRPFFLGIEGTGGRIAYVIDLSDSMLTPLTGEEIEELQKTPARPRRRAPVLTGGPSKGGQPAAPPKAPADARDAVDALPWDLIRTRFDAAREFLALSLRGLGQEQSFCVITFGSEAELLPATPGLQRATPKHVEAAVRALRAITPGRRTKDRPYGTLRGYTNLHGGLHLAFKLSGSRLVKEHEYVDEKTFKGGCDTIFVLSDGKPTWDDWPARDTLEADNTPGDPEFGAETTDSRMATFYGPYAIASWLLDDLRRLNLLRHVEVHCIGLGEYDPRLLAAIAHAGKGEFRRMGGGER